MSESVHERLQRRISETRDRLADDGKLLTVAQLECEYRSFRNRFGPDSLAGLSDPELLRALATRDSSLTLPNWMEWEGRATPSSEFGAVEPTGKHCLGLWFDDEEQCWCRFARRGEYMSRGTGRTRLNMGEAVELVREWRRQLLGAVSLVDALPHIMSDAVCAKLQNDLGSVAPDLVLHPWLHKYLAMLFPDRLDQFHREGWHRYLLVECFEAPPEGDVWPAAYRSAGRFARMARELSMPMNHLCLSMEALFGPPHGYWLLEMSEREWQEMTGQGFIAQCFPLLGDLNALGLEASRVWDDMVLVRLREHYPNDADYQVLEQIRWLVHKAQERDVILAHHDAKALGLAEIAGPYRYESSNDLAHRRPIRPLTANLSKLPPLTRQARPIESLLSNDQLLLAIEEALCERE